MGRYENLATEKFGSYYRRTGKPDELVFKCIKCGRPKLYVNTANGVFHCFRCDFSGRLRIKTSLKDIKNSFNEKSLKDLKDNELRLIPYITKPLTQLQIQALKNRGLTEDDIKYYNIMGRKEDDRIQIPNYIKGMFTDIICAWEYDKSKVTDENPKYLNTEGTEKSKTLFNIYNISDNVDKIILCEGVFNAITVGRNAVASYGCSFSERQLELILHKNPKSILIAYDGDEPGVTGSIKVLKMLKKSKYFGTVEYILLPKNVDANDLGRNNFWSYYNSNKVLIDLNNPISLKLPKLLYDSRI